MISPWLGQVPLRPWKRGPELFGSRSRFKLGQLACCVGRGGSPGTGVQYCYDTTAGQCALTWVSPEGVYPGVPQ